jgi:hypothetical protein
VDKLKIVLVALGVIILPIALWAGTLGFKWVSAEIRGQSDARETILADGNFRIQAYNHFFGLCASIQTHEDRISNLEDELHDELNPPSDARREQIHVSLTAIRNQRNSNINTYNTDAQREWTIGQFREEGLPYQIDSDNERTSCTVTDG